MNENNSFAYKGNVQISVIKNNKVLKKIKLDNSGGAPLFTLFTLAIKGDWKTCRDYQPSYIELFSLGAAGTTIPDDVLTGLTNSNRLATQSHFVSDTSAISTTTDPLSKSITQKFVIPYTHILEKENKDLNLLALYSNIEENKTNPDWTNYCAYVIIKNEDDESLLGKIDTSNVKKQDYTLVIDWTLTILNK